MLFQPKFACIRYQAGEDEIVSIYMCRGHRQAYDRLVEQYESDQRMEPEQELEELPSFAEFKKSLRKFMDRPKYTGLYYDLEFIQPVNG